jgi:hypothetical protein
VGRVDHVTIARLESDLLSIERQARSLKARPSFMRSGATEKKIDDLRELYREKHALWKAAKQQTSFDV